MCISRRHTRKAVVVLKYSSTIFLRQNSLAYSPWHSWITIVKWPGHKYRQISSIVAQTKKLAWRRAACSMSKAPGPSLYSTTSLPATIRSERLLQEIMKCRDKWGNDLHGNNQRKMDKKNTNYIIKGKALRTRPSELSKIAKEGDWSHQETTTSDRRAGAAPTRVRAVRRLKIIGVKYGACPSLHHSCLASRHKQILSSTIFNFMLGFLDGSSYHLWVSERLMLFESFLGSSPFFALISPGIFNEHSLNIPFSWMLFSFAFACSHMAFLRHFACWPTALSCDWAILFYWFSTMVFFSLLSSSSPKIFVTIHSMSLCRLYFFSIRHYSGFERTEDRLISLFSFFHIDLLLINYSASFFSRNGRILLKINFEAVQIFAFTAGYCLNSFKPWGLLALQLLFRNVSICFNSFTR